MHDKFYCFITKPCLTSILPTSGLARMGYLACGCWICVTDIRWLGSKLTTHDILVYHGCWTSFFTGGRPREDLILHFWRGSQNMPVLELRSLAKENRCCTWVWEEPEAAMTMLTESFLPYSENRTYLFHIMDTIQEHEQVSLNLETFYNQHRLHSTLGNLIPMQFDYNSLGLNLMSVYGVKISIDGGLRSVITCSYGNFRTRIPGHGITLMIVSRCKIILIMIHLSIFIPGFRSCIVWPLLVNYQLTVKTKAKTPWKRFFYLRHIFIAIGIVIFIYAIRKTLFFAGHSRSIHLKKPQMISNLASAKFCTF